MEWEQFIHDTWLTSVIFISLLVFTRILGNTQLAQLTFYDYISGITIGSLAANIMSAEPDKVWSHYYDLVLFVILTYAISVVTIASRPLRKMIEGSPVVVIKDGKIIKDNMRGMRYDLDELHAQLRDKGILDPSEVQYAIVETPGTLSVIKKSDYQPVTRSDLAIRQSEASLPIELIMDGEILYDNLKKSGYSELWLQTEVKKQGIAAPDAVMYGVIDSKGKFYATPISLPEKTNSNL